jgi:Fe-S cluster biogenesis protein NfuA
MSEQSLRDKVETALARIRPVLQADGGDVELVEIAPGNVVRVRLTGRCKGCPMSQQTLKGGVERVVLKEVPEIKAVEAVMEQAQ